MTQRLPVETLEAAPVAFLEADGRLLITDEAAAIKAAFSAMPEPATGRKLLPLYSADQYAALVTEVIELRKALEPFAAIGEIVMDRKWKPDDAGMWGYDGAIVTYGDFRRARASLPTQPQAEPEVEI